MREAMTFHIELLQDTDEPIPEPGTWTTTVQVAVPDGTPASLAPRSYLAVIEPEPDGWSAYVPDIHGCRVIGPTRLEVERNIHQALADCLAEMRVRGEPIPLPGRRTAWIEVEVPSSKPEVAPSAREAR